MDEDEPGSLALSLPLLLEFGARLLFNGLLTLLENFADERQPRTEQERDQKKGVEIDGNQHDFPAR